METNSDFYKKRIMFLKGEDFYFLTYNIIFFLYQIKATAKEQAMRDPRKLAFIVDFISQPSLVDLLAGEGAHKNFSNRQLLVHSYANGMGRIHIITRLITSLAQRGLVTINKGANRTESEIFLNADKLSEKFLTAEIYNKDKENIIYFCSTVKRVASLTLKTMLEKIYQENGISTWHA